MMYPTRTPCFACEIPTLYPGGHQVSYRKNPTLGFIPREANTEHEASSSFQAMFGRKRVWKTRKASRSVAVEKLDFFRLRYFDWYISHIFLSFFLFSVFRNLLFKTKMCWPAYGQVLTSQNNAWSSSEGWKVRQITEPWLERNSEQFLNGDRKTKSCHCGQSQRTHTIQRISQNSVDKYS